ncbi:hypothetical protein [Bradyrhizobium sp. LMTR 3]|nr:hypothetical protein [Bradyrhizobium sp. LMTR 3]
MPRLFARGNGIMLPVIRGRCRALSFVLIAAAIAFLPVGHLIASQ